MHGKHFTIVHRRAISRQLLCIIFVENKHLCFIFPKHLSVKRIIQIHQEREFLLHTHVFIELISGWCKPLPLWMITRLSILLCFFSYETRILLGKLRQDIGHPICERHVSSIDESLWEWDLRFKFKFHRFRQNLPLLLFVWSKKHLIYVGKYPHYFLNMKNKTLSKDKLNF